MPVIAEEKPATATVHELVVVGGETYTWTDGDDQAYALAAAEFKVLTRHRRAETRSADGQMEVVRELDPAAELTTVYPPIVGG
jgi:dihydrofolate reductase